MKPQEQGCSLNFKIVSLPSTFLAVGDKGNYLDRFIKFNSYIVLTGLSRRVFLEFGPENIAPVISCLFSAGVYAFDRFGPSLKPEQFLTPMGKANLNRRNCTPVICKTGFSDSRNRLWLASFGVQLEIIANLLRVTRLNDRHVFSSDALARQFFATLIFSMSNMIAHSIFAQRQAPGGRKFQNGPTFLFPKTGDLMVAVKPLSFIQQALKMGLSIATIFSTISLIGVIAESSGQHDNYAKLVAAFEILFVVPTIFYTFQTTNVLPAADMHHYRAAAEKGIFLVNSERLTAVSNKPFDGKHNHAEYSAIFTMLFIFIELVCGDQIEKHSEASQVFTRYLILYLLMNVGSSAAIYALDILRDLFLIELESDENEESDLSITEIIDSPNGGTSNV